MRFHGGNERAKIDFSVNLNPIGPPPRAYEIATNCLKGGVLERYPDYNYRNLKRAISEFYKFDGASLVPTAGGGEAINLAIFAFKPRRIAIVEPSYGEYEDLARALGIEYSPIFYRRDSKGFYLELSDLESTCKREDALIVITNPNNPLGLYVDRRRIYESLSRCEAKVMVDEAYRELCDRCYIEIDRDLPENFIVVRSISKWLSLPGLRIGFLYARDGELVEKIEAIRQPWNIGGLSECIVSSLLSMEREMRDFIEESRMYIAREREKLERGLRSLGIKTYESAVNFILAESPYMKNIVFELEREGIAVRKCTSFKGLGEEYVRIGIRKSWENEKLLESLERAMKH
ncbi:MAG: pyridoxal phosphate-dependent aminotransferase [Fervidicoccaceae archaeon]